MLLYEFVFILSAFLWSDALCGTPPEDGFTYFKPVKPDINQFPQKSGNKTSKQSSCDSCVFPFVLWGREYRTCTNVYSYPDVSPDYYICATEVDASNELVSWDYCAPECPGASKESTGQVGANPANEPGKCYCGVMNPDDPYSYSSDSKIVGGYASYIGMIPWQVGLLFSNTNEANQGCGGTLVGDQYVVTAAHCTDTASPGDVFVTVGNTILGTKFESKSFIIDVEAVINHPDYNDQTTENDISILRLAEKVDLYKYPHIKPACLPSYPYSGPGVVSGWGTVSSGGLMQSHLRDVEVDIYPQGDCGDYPPGDITPDMICAGYPEGGSDACQGDSGGPLVARQMADSDSYTLTGVVSWGYGCAQPNLPGIYANVSYFTTWLYDNMPDLYTCQPNYGDDGGPGGIPCNPENTINALVPYKKIKKVATKEECRDICTNEQYECQYFNFKDNKKSKKRICFLLKVVAKPKQGFCSGESGCSFYDYPTGSTYAPLNG